MRFVTTLPSPVGRLTLASDGEAITGLWLEGQKYFGAGLSDTVQGKNLPVFAAAGAWLKAYFSRAPLPPLPPLSPQGSPFRQAVWQLLREILGPPSPPTAPFPGFGGFWAFPHRPRRWAEP